MTVFTNVSGELHAWLSEKGIEAPVVVLSFDDERQAAKFSWEVQREHEMFQPTSGKIEAGMIREFEAHGVKFKIVIRPKVV